MDVCIKLCWALGLKATRRRNTGAHTVTYKRKDGSEGRSHIRYGKAGDEDIETILPPYGRYCAIETKAVDGEQSEEQKGRQAEVEAAGGVYILARSSEELEKALKPLLVSAIR